MISPVFPGIGRAQKDGPDRGDARHQMSSRMQAIRWPAPTGPAAALARRRPRSRRAAGAEDAARGRVRRAGQLALQDLPLERGAGRGRAPTAAPAYRDGAGWHRARRRRDLHDAPEIQHDHRVADILDHRRSWPMNSIDRPSRTCRSRNRLMICAWIDTSSAETGSSATMKSAPGPAPGRCRCAGAGRRKIHGGSGEGIGRQPDRCSSAPTRSRRSACVPICWSRGPRPASRR